MKPAASIEQHSFRGEPAITLRAGELAATFVPDVGMTGVSLRYRGREHLALPGGLDALRAGRTAGLPLLAPWGNRLAARRYRAAGVDVDLRGLRLGTDDNGLPIHGLLVGAPGWRVDGQVVRGATARLTHVDRRRRARVPVPPSHRAGDRRARRDPRHRHDDRPHRAPAGARRVRLAPVPEGSRYPAEPVAPAPARAHPPGARLARDPHWRVRHRATRGSTDRQANLRRPLRARARPPPRVRGRRRRRDRAALWARLSVRAGLGAEGTTRSPRSSR